MMKGFLDFLKILFKKKKIQNNGKEKKNTVLKKSKRK